jgi:hypothetical protein
MEIRVVCAPDTTSGAVVASSPPCKTTLKANSASGRLLGSVSLQFSSGGAMVSGQQRPSVEPFYDLFRPIGRSGALSVPIGAGVRK